MKLLRLQVVALVVVGARHTASRQVSFPVPLGAPHSAFVEHGERDDRLCDADAVATEDASESKLLRVLDDFFDGFAEGDFSFVDRRGLHNDLETRQRVGDCDVDRRDDCRGDQVGGKAGQRRLGAEFLLDVLLELWLPDEAEGGRGQGVAHQREGATEQRLKILCFRFRHDFHDRLLDAGRLEEGTLLLLNHTHRVDERCGQDGCRSSSAHAHIAVAKNV